MTESKRIKFGIQMPQEAVEFETLRAHAVEAERLGYDSFWLDDHLTPLSPTTHIPDAWTTLTALAACTSTIRCGVMVLCNGFRHPPLVGNMAATLDRISGGRLEFAAGAGWMPEDFRTYGYEFPIVSERIARLEEAVQIWKKMWTEERPVFDGHYYRIDGIVGCPKPMQLPHPPITIGGRGEKLLLRLVARYADRWNGAGLSVEEMSRKVRILEKHCSDAGRNPEEIEISWCGQIYIDEDEERLRTRLASRKQLFDKERSIIAGTPEQFLDQIKGYIHAGVSYFIFLTGRVSDLRSTRILADKVIPAFR